MTELVTVQPAQRAPPRLLQRRVDWLTVAFRIELSPERVEYFASRAELANEHGRAEVELIDPDGHALLFELKRTRAPGRWYLSNAELQVLVDLEAPGRHLNTDGPVPEPIPGWTVEITARATYLATHELEPVLDAMRSTAAAFGVCRAERLRRFDLAADFDGWELDPEDCNAWLRHPRAHLFAYFDPNGAQSERARLHFVNGGSFTGFTIGQGGPVRMRLYDKTRELVDVPNEAKSEIETAAWTKAGWEGGTVARLEFQIRSEALDELCMRDPAILIGKADAVWAYLTQRWARLVVPDTATRLSRCKLDARWIAAQAVRFFHEASPAVRVRLRGACGFDQLFGSAVSYLSADGNLAAMADSLKRAGDERALAANMSPDERAAFVRSVSDEIAQELARAFATHWLKDPRRAVEKIATTIRAYRARFAQGPPKKKR